MWQCTGPGPFLEQCFSYCHAAFAGPWVLGLGFWWTCLSHVSFLLDRQHPLPPTSSNDPLCTCLLSTKPPWTKLCMWGCPCAGAGHSHLPLLLSSLTRPTLAAVFGTSFEQGGLLPGTRPGLWSAVRSYHGSTKQSWFQFHFPLAQRGVSYSWRCLFSPHYSLLAKSKPEKQADKLNKLFVSHCLTQWKHWSPRGLCESTRSAKPWLRMCPASVKYLSTGHKSNSPMSNINPHTPFLRNGFLES